MHSPKALETPDALSRAEAARKSVLKHFTTSAERIRNKASLWLLHPQFNRASRLCKRKHAIALFARLQFMGNKNETNSDARLAYELHLGRRVSDNHWYKVKRNLEDGGFEVTADTAVFYAKLKQHLPRTSVGTLKVFEHYQKAEKLLAHSASKIKGLEILEILSNQGINPHPATISRWFRTLGGFRKTRYYYPEKLTPVLTAAFIYQTVNSTKLGA